MSSTDPAPSPLLAPAAETPRSAFSRLMRDLAWIGRHRNPRLCDLSERQLRDIGLSREAYEHLDGVNRTCASEQSDKAAERRALLFVMARVGR